MIDETKLRFHMQNAKSKGWTIEPMVWRSNLQRCCCPVGSVAVSLDADVTSITGFAADNLGEEGETTPAELCVLADGFDGSITCQLVKYQAAFDLGQKLRMEWEAGKL